MRTSPAIAVYSPCDLSNNDGFNGHLRALIEHLARKCDVKVIGYSKGDPVLPNIYKRIKRSGLAGMLLAGLAFVVAILRERPDAVVLTSAGSILNPLLCFIASVGGAAILYDCQDPALEAVMRIYDGSLIRPILRRYLIRAEKLIDRFATLTLTVSPGLTQTLRSRGWSGPIEHYYNAHNARVPSRENWNSLRTDDSWRSSIILVYVGGMQRGSRGLEDQFKAVEIARNHAIDARFVVAYGSGEPEEFKEYASRLRTHLAYKEFAHVNASDIMDLLRDCDVALNKTLKIALPSKIFEYVASGLVIFSINDDSNVNEFFRDFVTLVRDDPQSMAEAIATIDTSKRARADRRLRGELFVDAVLKKNLETIENFVQLLIARNA